MKTIWQWTQEWFAYLMLPIIYYTLRIFRAPFWWIPIESHEEWSVTETLLVTDIMIFIAIIVLSGLWLFIGLWWVLYGFLTLLGMVLVAAGFFKLRKLSRNRKN